MTTRRKSKRQNDSTPIDEKEHADRIAAAEAMSCLSSMVVLPSNSEDLFALSSDINSAPVKKSSATEKNNAKSTTSNASKKGKTRNRAAKNSPPAATKKSQSTNDNNMFQINKQKQKTPRYAPTLAVGNKKVNKLPDQVLSLTINPRNPNHEQKRPEVTKTVHSELKKEEEQELQPPVLTPAIAQIDHSNVAQQCIVQVDHTKPGRGLYNLSSNDLHKLLAGKLPFEVKAGGTKQQEMVAKHVASKFVALASGDSVELPQSAVDSILTQIVLKHKFETKEASESSLPLKKRRLQGYKEDDPLVITDGPDKSTDQDSGKNEGPSMSKQQERVNPVAVDPSTSLMLLSEMQVALQQDEDGDLPLHIAVVHENIVMVQKFVHLMSISGKSVDKYNKAQQTPLHIAVELNFIQAVHTLLLAGANPNLVNKNGENCIHMAVKASSLDCLQLIFKFFQKCDINARNFDGMAPIHVAVMKNDIDIVRFLLAEKADVNIQDGKSGRTPLFYAVEGNNLPMVELFQKVGANLDLPNYASITAVMAAQARGFHEVASVLLRCMDSKAYLEMKEKEKGTPLKKVPIPRIPSKSHLIQNSDNKPSIIDLHQLTNSDSNDSSQSGVQIRKRAKSTDKKEKEPVKQDKDRKPDLSENEKTQNKPISDEKQPENNTKISLTDAQDPVQKQSNEGILIPRELLERLQNTMLTLLAMQKGQQLPGATPISGTTVATSQGVETASIQSSRALPVQNTGIITQSTSSLPVQSATLPVQITSGVPVSSTAGLTKPAQSTSGLSLSSILQSAITVNHSDAQSSQNKGVEKSISINSISGTNASTQMNNSKSVKETNVQKKVNEKVKENNKTKHIMLQQLLNVKNSDLDKSVEKKQKVVETIRVEEPMDVSESGNSSDNSQQYQTKFNKNSSIGHAAMNQLGRVTSVSSSLQATLLQMLQAKQNKPLNLSTSKESSS